MNKRSTLNIPMRTIRKWLTPGLGVKRWLILLGLGITILSIAVAQLIVEVYRSEGVPQLLTVITLRFLPPLWRVLIALAVGVGALVIALRELNRSIIAPFSRRNQGDLLDIIYRDARLKQGIKVVALGGGTGLPAVLRGMKDETSQITAIVTMADDGGSSGRLRREFGVLPPGDVRNNIAALADDEAMMTQLFQYRFAEGGLAGHSFGNLFLTALAAITGSMEGAIVEAGRVLAIEGRVLPSTIQDVKLAADIRQPDGKLTHVEGESQIPEVGGKIEHVSLVPTRVRAFPDAIRAILTADVIVIGPGSLYTSILPNLLVDGIPEAIRASTALKVYICNIATQRGETDGFTVADHILAIERHVGRGVFRVVLANNAQPTENAGGRTVYVKPAPPAHDVRDRYEVIETDLTDPQRPWRHSPEKLRKALVGRWATHKHVEKADKQGEATSTAIPMP
jgi:uncharacterized cofD-like protein